MILRAEPCQCKRQPQTEPVRTCAVCREPVYANEPYTVYPPTWNQTATYIHLRCMAGPKVGE